MSRIGTTSQSAKNMALLFQEMRSKEARNYLAPHLKHLSSRKTRAGDIRKRDLQALACHWKLNKIPGFWSENDTEEALLSSLYKHAKKMEEASKPKERPAKEKRKVSVVVEPTQEEDIDWQATMRDVGKTLRPYKGDLFGTRGDYNGGLIYASRRPASAVNDTSRYAQKTSSQAQSDQSTRDHDKGNEDQSSSGNSAQQNALEQLKINSTAMLHQLSKQPTHKKDLASAEAVEAVFRMWRNSPNDQVRRNCAMTLANLFTTTSMERDDVLAPILQLAKESMDPAVQATVAKAMLTRVLQKRPLALGYVPEVISAVRTMKSRCLSTTKRNIAQVLRLLLERGQATRRRSAKADSAEGKDGDERKSQSDAAANTSLRVLEIAASEGMLSLLANLAMDPDDGERQEHCSKAMLELTKLPQLHADMSGRSVLPVIVSLLQSPSPQTCDNASLLMFELVCSPDQAVSSRLVHNEDVTAALLSVVIAQAGVLTDTEQGDDTDRTPAQVMHMGERATAAILTLSGEPLLLSGMVKAGVADALFSWFNYGDDHVKHNCVMALCNLFACLEGQAALVQLGFVRVIIAAANIKPVPESKEPHGMFDNEDENYADPDVDVGVRKRCSRALCMLSSGGSELADHLIEENAVVALVRLTETLDHEVRLNCVQALMHLSKWPVSHPAMIENGAIGALSQFSSSKDPDVLEAVTLGLCNLANSEDSHHALLAEDVVSTLVRLAGATGLRQQCVSAFCQLSAFRPAHEAIIHQGVLPMLIAQSRFTNAHIRRECAQALYNLSCMVGSEAQEVAHGVPAALTIVALFRADDGLTKDLCAAALFNLMYDPAGRQQLLDDGVLWAFIKLALAGTTTRTVEDGCTPPKADTAETCTRLIRNLSCDDEMCRHTIEKRTLAALSKFAPSANPTTRLNCAITLCEITRRQHLHEAAVDRGIMTVLVKLANVQGDLSVAECCATVLFRLTQKPESRDKLAGEEHVPHVLSQLLRTAIRKTVEVAGSMTRGPAAGEDAEAHSAAVVEGKKRALALKRCLAVVATNLTGNRAACPALIANGFVQFLNLLVRSGGPATAVPPNAVPADDVVDCPLADAVALNAVVRSVYNLTAEQECCALLAATAAHVTTTVSHVLASVASDTTKSVYEDETAEMAAITVVNLSAQESLVGSLYNAQELNSIIAIGSARASVQTREACSTALTNLIVGGLHSNEDAAEQPAVYGPLLQLWEQSAHGETQHHATCDAYCFLFWFLAQRQASLAALLEQGLLHAVQKVVQSLTRREDKTVTDRERLALLLECAFIVQRVSEDEGLRGAIFEGEGQGVAALMKLSTTPHPLIQRSVSQSLANMTHSHALRARVIQHQDIVPYMAGLANKSNVDKVSVRVAVCMCGLHNGW